MFSFASFELISDGCAVVGVKMMKQHMMALYDVGLIVQFGILRSSSSCLSEPSSDISAGPSPIRRFCWCKDEIIVLRSTTAPSETLKASPTQLLSPFSTLKQASKELPNKIAPVDLFLWRKCTYSESLVFLCFEKHLIEIVYNRGEHRRCLRAKRFFSCIIVVSNVARELLLL